MKIAIHKNKTMHQLVREDAPFLVVKALTPNWKLLLGCKQYSNHSTGQSTPNETLNIPQPNRISAKYQRTKSPAKCNT
jgi:hypothetical protein